MTGADDHPEGPRDELAAPAPAPVPTSGKDKKGKGSARSKEGGKDAKDARDAKKAAAAAAKPRGKAPAGAAPAAAPAFQMSPDDLRVVVARWRSEADEFDRAAEAVPVTFDRTLGIAVRAVGKEAFKEALGAWDKDGKGLKMVDFRRCMRNELKLKATNHDIDKLVSRTGSNHCPHTLSVLLLTAGGLILFTPV